MKKFVSKKDFGRLAYSQVDPEKYNQLLLQKILTAYFTMRSSSPNR